MQNKLITNNDEFDELYDDIKKLVHQSRSRVYKTVNTEMISLYWNIGKMIVEKQEGNRRAKYKKILIAIQNLRKMKQFYISFPIRSTLSGELRISHYFELIKIKDKKQKKSLCTRMY